MPKPAWTRTRRLVAAVPAARLLYETFVDSPGSWLYRDPVTRWLSDPALVDQLPRPYRLFARFCVAQPVGAELLLRLIVCLRRAHGDCIPLKLEDVTIFLDLHDPRFLRVPGEIEALTPLISRLLRPGDTFLDVGANQGAYSVVAARRVGASGFVVAVEPQPRLALALRQSLSAGPAPFEVHQVASADSAGEAELHIPLSTSGMAGRFRGYSAQCRHRTITVPLRPLDDILGERPLPGRVFLKIDVEGGEIAVLRGAPRLIQAARPVILTEVNPPALAAAAASADDLLGLLRSLGYDRYVTRARPDLERPLTTPIADPDIIALPATGG